MPQFQARPGGAFVRKKSDASKVESRRRTDEDSQSRAAAFFAAQQAQAEEDRKKEVRAHWHEARSKTDLLSAQQSQSGVFSEVVDAEKAHVEFEAAHEVRTNSPDVHRAAAPGSNEGMTEAQVAYADLHQARVEEALGLAVDKVFSDATARDPVAAIAAILASLGRA